MAKTRKVIVTVAVTGSIGDKSRHPALPVTPKEIAESALDAHAVGASVAHIHVRDPKTAEPSMDLALYKEVVDRIRERSDMVINLTTGAGARIVPDENDPVGLGRGTSWRHPETRTRHVTALKPELCSLDVGSVNFGPRVFANILPHVEEMARIALDAGVKPELEVFELGHIRIAKHLIEEGLVSAPPLFQLCLGVPWGVPADTKHIFLMKEDLPRDSLWGGFGIGASNFPMVAQSALLGGNIRVGFEDNFYLSPGNPAKDNAELVAKAVGILNALDMEPASTRETREILDLK